MNFFSRLFGKKEKTGARPLPIVTPEKNTWEPISLRELNLLIHEAESVFTREMKDFWELIKISPEKWGEKEYGNRGGGFWAVAIWDRQVVWYNDIEDGFNISPYKTYGRIDEYGCCDDELHHTIFRLLNGKKEI